MWEALPAIFQLAAQRCQGDAAPTAERFHHDGATVSIQIRWTVRARYYDDEVDKGAVGTNNRKRFLNGNDFSADVLFGRLDISYRHEG